ncbi:MAG TPA: PLP-dependent aminotransferase family protein, partial [Anaerolineae bacterium]|nr:PLP-dependent aminotransferase family protein [Anaerolineae bacterium]
FQNPGGVTLSLERRYEVIAMADHRGVPILEDDPYGDLRYEGERLPPLIALDAQRMGPASMDACQGNVIYLGTFSKTLAPGLRLGWILASAEIIRYCVYAKQGMDLHTSTFAQMVAYEVARGGFLEQHVRHICQVYGERRDVMLRALEEFFPPGIRWTQPKGGLFLWVILPETIDTGELLPEAVEKERVAFVPGSVFYPGQGGHNTMRLNFSNARPEMIREGIRRLGRVVAAKLENRVYSAAVAEKSPS